MKDKKTPKVSVIIPLYVNSFRFFSDLKKFDELDYLNFDIIIVSDKKVHLPELETKVTLILTGKERTGPAEKRDLAISKTDSDICAFIDDDAYPDPCWLSEGMKSLTDHEIAAVGGPGITPPEDPFMAQLGGRVYESVLTSGKAQDRFLPKTGRTFVKDWPAYNLLVRTKVLKKVGGYGSSFYGGEDTFLCLKIINLDKKIVYNSKMIVYHHRRPLFIPHLAQIQNVGIHRGYFARVYPKTSRRLFYFVPSILTIGFFSLGLIAFFNRHLFFFFLSAIMFFYILAFILSYRRFSTLIETIFVALGIMLTHLTYGVGFMKGIFTSKLTK